MPEYLFLKRRDDGEDPLGLGNRGIPIIDLGKKESNIYYIERYGPVPKWFLKFFKRKSTLRRASVNDYEVMTFKF